MPDNQILEQITTNTKMLDSVANRLDLLKLMFGGASSESIVATDNGFIYCETVKATTVYQDECSTIVIFDMQRNGDIHPIHRHINSLEFVIVTSGTVEFEMEGVVSTLKKGDHVSVPSGVDHTCKALVDGTMIVSVTIPPEKAYIVESLWSKSKGDS